MVPKPTIQQARATIQSRDTNIHHQSQAKIIKTRVLYQQHEDILTHPKVKNDLDQVGEFKEKFKPIKIALPKCKDEDTLVHLEDLVETDNSPDYDNQIISLGESPNFKNISHIRKDVIGKGLVRQFRKYYIREFRKFYRYTKHKRTKTEKVMNKIIEKVKEFGQNLLPFQLSEKFVSVFLSLVDMSGSYIPLNAEFESLRNKLHEMLFKFSFYKTSRIFSEYPDLGNLLIHFLTLPETSRYMKTVEGDDALNHQMQQVFESQKQVLINL